MRIPILVVAIAAAACTATPESSAPPAYTLHGVFRTNSAAAPFAEIELHENRYRLAPSGEEGSFAIGDGALSLVVDGSGKSYSLPFDVVATAKTGDLSIASDDSLVHEPSSSLVEKPSGPLVVSVTIGGSDYELFVKKLSPSEIADLLRAAGFPASVIPKMVCTAKWESSFDEGAVNSKNKNGSVDRGLFQINSVHLGDNGCPSKADASDLFDPETNVRCAYQVYRSGGLDSWYGYKAHRAECDGYRLP